MFLNNEKNEIIKYIEINDKFFNRYISISN